MFNNLNNVPNKHYAFYNSVFFSRDLFVLPFVFVKTTTSTFRTKTTTSSDQAIEQAPVQPYHIKPDDMLQIRNLQDTKYLVNDGGGGAGGGGGGQIFQVEEDGRVTLPVIGHIPVAGLTRYQAARKIEKLYTDSLLVNPIIDLKILNLNVKVFGESKGTGVFPLAKDRTTLVDILGLTGGLTANADEKHVKIIRNEAGTPKTIWVDLSSINVLNDPKIVLQPDDIVYIAQNKRAVRDDKIQNISSLVQPSLLIFNTALIIYTLFR